MIDRITRIVWPLLVPRGSAWWLNCGNVAGLLCRAADDCDISYHAGLTKPRIRVQARRRVISMDEYFLLGSQWRPGEIQWVSPGAGVRAIIRTGEKRRLKPRDCYGRVSCMD